LGPSRLMAIMLIIGSIPLGFSALVTSSTGLIVVRAFIGVLGATFVPCQYWTTALFSKKIVGTANAIVGGWGNMGAGATNLLMPQVYAMFKAFGLSTGTSWRASLQIPVVLCLIVAALIWFFGEDKPSAEYIKAKFQEDHSLIEKKDVEGETVEKKKTAGSVATDMLKTLINPNVLLLCFAYACTFGVELSVDGAVGDYFIKTFGVTQQIGALFGAVFGLMNIFSRASGGIISDFAHDSMGLQGRYIWLIILSLISSASIIGFSYCTTIEGAIVTLIIFSYCCQAGCGATYGIVPFVSEYMGTVSGLVGAGGSIGGALFNVVFSIYVKDPATAFRIMGIVVAVSAFFTCFLNVQKQSLLKFFKSKKSAEKVPTDEKEANELSGTTVDI
ncbi:High-affinity nitrate transporter 2.1, partial [Nowakowskiella sp. JEL0078]